LSRAGLKPQSVWFQEASDRTLLRRQMLNLSRALEGAGRQAESRQARYLVDLLDRSFTRR
jgi:hypothetical protein